MEKGASLKTVPEKAMEDAMEEVLRVNLTRFWRKVVAAAGTLIQECGEPSVAVPEMPTGSILESPRMRTVLPLLFSHLGSMVLDPQELLTQLSRPLAAMLRQKVAQDMATYLKDQLQTGDPEEDFPF